MIKLYKDIEVDDQLGEYFGEDGIKEVKQGSLSNLGNEESKSSSFGNKKF